MAFTREMSGCTQYGRYLAIIMRVNEFEGPGYFLCSRDVDERFYVLSVCVCLCRPMTKSSHCEKKIVCTLLFDIKQFDCYQLHRSLCFGLRCSQDIAALAPTTWIFIDLL